MMFSFFKSQSSLVSFIAACPFYIAIIMILIQSSNRSNNYLVEAFAPQKFTGASRIVVSQTVSSASLLSYCSLLSTVPSSPTSSESTSTILYATSLPDDDVYAPIVMDPLPSIIDSKTSHNQEKKKKLWHHQDSGLESKLILVICSYHALKLLIDMIHLS
mmetsp:Transcript_26995/g.30906  ORF Transcript_26995/g.30906 Transcript_26995/m.30906 type:complete len:160 (+) Transcript_26995:109-588(+)